MHASDNACMQATTHACKRQRMHRGAKAGASASQDTLIAGACTLIAGACTHMPGKRMEMPRAPAL
eukprot:3818551-Pleurochrysis_carterae.AAC.4